MIQMRILFRKEMVISPASSLQLNPHQAVLEDNPGVAEAQKLNIQVEVQIKWNLGSRI